MSLSPKVYTGPYRNPEHVAGEVLHVNDIRAEIKEGVLVAVLVDWWKKRPVIGKVLDVSEEQFRIHWWKGRYTTEWFPEFLINGQPYTDLMPMSCVVCVGFEFTGKGKNKLSKQMKDTLKNEYHNIDAIAVENVL